MRRSARASRLRTPLTLRRDGSVDSTRSRLADAARERRVVGVARFVPGTDDHIDPRLGLFTMPVTLGVVDGERVAVPLDQTRDPLVRAATRRTRLIAHVRRTVKSQCHRRIMPASGGTRPVELTRFGGHGVLCG
jgi:hypothetical protein